MCDVSRGHNAAIDNQGKGTNTNRIVMFQKGC